MYASFQKVIVVVVSSLYYLFRFTILHFLHLSNVIVVDLNNNGKKDFIIVDTFADNNSRSVSGSLYTLTPRIQGITY